MEPSPAGGTLHWPSPAAVRFGLLAPRRCWIRLAAPSRGERNREGEILSSGTFRRRFCEMYRRRPTRASILDPLAEIERVHGNSYGGLALETFSWLVGDRPWRPARRTLGA